MTKRLKSLVLIVVVFTTFSVIYAFSPVQYYLTVNSASVITHLTSYITGGVEASTSVLPAVNMQLVKITNRMWELNTFPNALFYCNAKVQLKCNGSPTFFCSSRYAQNFPYYNFGVYYYGATKHVYQETSSSLKVSDYTSSAARPSYLDWEGYGNVGTPGTRGPQC